MHKSKDLHLPHNVKFPHKFDEKLNMISVFFVEDDKIQEKTMQLKLVATDNGLYEEHMGDASFDISKFYDKKNQKHEVSFKGDNFKMKMNISVVKVDAAHSIGVDVQKLIRED